MSRRLSLSLLAFSVLLASCTTSRTPQPVAPVAQGGVISGPGNYQRPSRDGAPWWDVDVSRIPDAVPMPITASSRPILYGFRADLLPDQ